MPTAAPHIAILSPFLRGNKGHGGITPWVINVANGLAARGAKVELLVNAKAKTPLQHSQLSPGITIINLGRRKLLALWALLKYLKRSHPDALLTAGHRYNAMGCWAKRFTTTPVYLSVHENLSASSQTLSETKRRRRQRQVAKSFARCDGVIAVSQGVADDLIAQGLPAGRCTVIHNPIINDTLLEKAQQGADHPWLHDGQAPLLIAVGRLEAQKDYPTLIRALSTVLQQRPNTRLIILGEGSYRNELTRLIGELGLQAVVEMPGHVANPMAYMAAADLFVLSSAWEGFGNVLVEALAVGTPVVATDCPSGPSEILADGQYGPLVPVGDSAALADAIIQTLDKPLSAEQLKQRSRAFSVDAAVGRYYQTLLSKTSPGLAEPRAC